MNVIGECVSPNTNVSMHACAHSLRWHTQALILISPGQDSHTVCA